MHMKNFKSYTFNWTGGLVFIQILGCTHILLDK